VRARQRPLATAYPALPSPAVLPGTSAQISIAMLTSLFGLHVLFTCRPFIADGDDKTAIAAKWAETFILFGLLLTKVQVR